MYTPPRVSNAAIGGATLITAKDPATEGWFLLWRGDSASNDGVVSSAASDSKSIEIIVSEDDDGALLELIGRIERIKGTLPWEAQALRRLIQSQSLTNVQ